ncbi:MAG: PH domain-containing protein [Patescibacteria group bacterium]|nr:PH domain-containing protein [Patescibacteria group bacterium]
MPEIYNAEKNDSKLISNIHSENDTKESSENDLIDTLDSEAQQNRQSKKAFQPFKFESNADSNSRVFSSYCINPKNVNFYHKDSQEKVILLLRKHPFTNIPWIFTALLMFLAPIFVSFFGFIEIVPWEFKFVLFVVWYMITLAFVLEEFLSWFYNVNIITDERILEVDFVNLVYREITDANIDQIQDVTVEMSGVWRTFFNFGDVVIQTAGEVPRIRFEAVPRPDDVAKILRELRLEEEQEKLEGRIR